MAFQNKTVFVVGAGGSAEVGLPMGADLKDKISKKLNIRYKDGYQLVSGDKRVVSALKAYGQHKGIRDLNPLFQAGRKVAAAMPLALSIDNFLHMHAHDELVVKMGKIGIAASIMEAEASSKIMPRESDRGMLHFTADNQSWHMKFVQMALEGIQVSDVETIFDNVSVISFNYDRCILHYLCHALATQLSIDLPRAKEIASKLEIIHPYGQVGKLPLAIGQPGFEFGTPPDVWNLVEIAQGIRTFTERIDDEDMLSRMRDLIIDAQQIVFIGFAFWPINMELLTIAHEGENKSIFATAYGLSEAQKFAADMSIIKAFSAFGKNELSVKLIDAKAFDMLSDYYPAIAN